MTCQTEETMTMWVRSHVERLLQDEWDEPKLAVDPDGDYPFRRGTAAGWVSVIEGGGAPFVRVWAWAATGIKASAAMWRELNELQLSATTCALLWQDGTVIVSQTVSSIGLTRPVLAQALSAVGHCADDTGLLLAGMFGGATPFPAEDTTDVEAS